MIQDNPEGLKGVLSKIYDLLRNNLNISITTRFPNSLLQILIAFTLYYHLPCRLDYFSSIPQSL
jgi:hypothetical protein